MTNSSNVCFVFGNLSGLKYSSDFGTSRSKKIQMCFSRTPLHDIYECDIVPSDVWKYRNISVGDTKREYNTDGSSVFLHQLFQAASRIQ